LLAAPFGVGRPPTHKNTNVQASKSPFAGVLTEQERYRVLEAFISAHPRADAG
jgi:hypothetical protein